jgi:hypothetical protein
MIVQIPTGRLKGHEDRCHLEQMVAACLRSFAKFAGDGSCLRSRGQAASASLTPHESACPN